jgi:hypothetical protein
MSHAWWNSSPKPARYLIVKPERINELIAQIHSHTSGPNALRGLFRRNNSELIDGEA